ncbi:MAG: bacteriophage abortive infection AbiH family protein, partial [Oscillospiraceae bacterium]|nr:bacteriophage abortive infection AbiH family protein [Oscillospiraceae bacterium]
MYKKILVLGNGFDLAHGLPTQYKHFIEFCEKATLI